MYFKKYGDKEIKLLSKVLLNNKVYHHIFIIFILNNVYLFESRQLLK